MTRISNILSLPLHDHLHTKQTLMWRHTCLEYLYTVLRISLPFLEYLWAVCRESLLAAPPLPAVFAPISNCAHEGTTKLTNIDQTQWRTVIKIKFQNLFCVFCIFFTQYLNLLHFRCFFRHFCGPFPLFALANGRVVLSPKLVLMRGGGGRVQHG